MEVATLLNALTTIRQFAGNDNGGDDDWLFPQGKQNPETKIFFMTMELCLFWACFSLRVGARRMKVRCWSFNLVSKQKFYLKTQQGLPSAVLRLQSTLLSVIWSEHKPLAILHSSPSFAQGPQSENFDFLRSSLIWFDFLIDCDRKLPVQQFSLTCDALTAAAALLSLSPQSAAKRQQKTEYCPLHFTPEMTSFRMDSLMYLECITEKGDIVLHTCYASR